MNRYKPVTKDDLIESMYADEPIEPYDEPLLTAPYNHEGNAICLLELYQNTFIYSDKDGWRVHNGTHFEHNGAEAVLERAIFETLRIRREIDAFENQGGHENSYEASIENIQGVMEQLRLRDEVRPDARYLENPSDFDRRHRTNLLL